MRSKSSDAFLAAPSQDAKPEAVDLVRNWSRQDVAGDRMVVEPPSDHGSQPRPTSTTGSCMRRLNCTLISCSFARIRLAIDFRLIVNAPFRVVPQQCVKPRKSNVSGLPAPPPLVLRPHSDRTRSGGSSPGAAGGRTSQLAPQFPEAAFGVHPVLESHDEIVGVADDDNVPRA